MNKSSKKLFYLYLLRFKKINTNILGKFFEIFFKSLCKLKISYIILKCIIIVLKRKSEYILRSILNKNHSNIFWPKTRIFREIKLICLE